MFSFIKNIKIYFMGFKKFNNEKVHELLINVFTCVEKNLISVEIEQEIHRYLNSLNNNVVDYHELLCKVLFLMFDGEKYENYHDQLIPQFSVHFTLKNGLNDHMIFIPLDICYSNQLAFMVIPSKSSTHSVLTFLDLEFLFENFNSFTKFSELYGLKEIIKDLYVEKDLEVDIYCTSLKAE